MSDLVSIADLPRRVGETVRVGGWVTHARSKGKLCFAVVRGDLAQRHEQIGFIALGKLPEVRRQGHN